jgi:DNA repair protein RadC
MTDIISDMPVDDRPRERLLAHGARTLSDAELIGLLLGCGTEGKNAMQLARELLPGGFTALATREPAQLAHHRGMGMAKAARIAATFEIARRLAAEKPIDHPAFDVDVTGAGLVSTMMRQRQERLGAFFLDSRGKILRQREIFVGTVSHAVVSTRDILRAAVEENGVAIALYHNHPSGDPTPSGHDVEFTRRLHDALALADIELVDHLIIGAHRFLSMKRKGLF